jgi:hypothetical protein
MRAGGQLAGDIGVESIVMDVRQGEGERAHYLGTADVSAGTSLAATLAFFFLCLAIVAWIFRTGYRLKT